MNTGMNDVIRAEFAIRKKNSFEGSNLMWILKWFLYLSLYSGIRSIHRAFP